MQPHGLAERAQRRLTQTTILTGWLTGKLPTMGKVYTRNDTKVSFHGQLNLFLDKQVSGKLPTIPALITWSVCQTL